MMIMVTEDKKCLTFSQRHTNGLVLRFLSIANAALAS